MIFLIACPELLHFNPYTKEEITAIIEKRLSSMPNIFGKMAIQFCARKISSANGDIRKALDMCRRAVELATSTDRSVTSVITVGHIATVINEMDKDRAATHNIPLQEKLVACCVLLLYNNGVKEPEMGKVRYHFIILIIIVNK